MTGGGGRKGLVMGGGGRRELVTGWGGRYEHEQQNFKRTNSTSTDVLHEKVNIARIYMLQGELGTREEGRRKIETIAKRPIKICRSDRSVLFRDAPKT